MRKIFPIMALLLSACGQQADPVSDNHGYGWHYDAVTASGTKVRYSSEEERAAYTPEEIEQHINLVNACAPSAVAVPFVIFTADPIPYEGTEKNGVAFIDPDLIVVHGNYYGNIFSHEVIHIILNRDLGLGKNDFGESNHDHEMFSRCEIMLFS